MSFASEIQRDLNRLLTSGDANTANVTVVWNAADFSGSDKNLEGTYPAEVLQSGTWPALVHYVQPITTGIRQFAEMQVGDVILDFASMAAIPATAKGATFRIEGDPQVYVQKSIGKDLADAWDMVVGGQRVIKTYLVTGENA